MPKKAFQWLKSYSVPKKRIQINYFGSNLIQYKHSCFTHKGVFMHICQALIQDINKWNVARIKATLIVIGTSERTVLKFQWSQDCLVFLMKPSRELTAFLVEFLISPKRTPYLPIWNIYPKVKTSTIHRWWAVPSLSSVPNSLKGYYAHSSFQVCLTEFDSLYWTFLSLLLHVTKSLSNIDTRKLIFVKWKMAVQTGKGSETTTCVLGKGKQGTPSLFCFRNLPLTFSDFLS